MVARLRIGSRVVSQYDQIDARLVVLWVDMQSLQKALARLVVVSEFVVANGRAKRGFRVIRICVENLLEVRLCFLKLAARQSRATEQPLSFRPASEFQRLFSVIRTRGHLILVVCKARQGQLGERIRGADLYSSERLGFRALAFPCTRKCLGLRTEQRRSIAAAGRRGGDQALRQLMQVRI